MRVCAEADAHRMSHRDETLAQRRLDAHDVVFGSEERLASAAVGQKSIAAERQLRLMAFDGVEFSFLLTPRKFESAQCTFGGCVSMDDVRCDGRIRRCAMCVVGNRTMVRVLIKSRRADDQSRREIVDCFPESLAQCDISSPRQRPDALIGEFQENCRALADAEARQRAESFAAAHRAPGRAVGIRKKEFSLQETLRPGIVFSVGDKDDGDLTAAFQDALDEAPSRDDVVVRMRRQDHSPASRKWESLGIHDRAG